MRTKCRLKVRWDFQNYIRLTCSMKIVSVLKDVKIFPILDILQSKITIETVLNGIIIRHISIATLAFWNLVNISYVCYNSASGLSTDGT